MFISRIKSLLHNIETVKVEKTPNIEPVDASALPGLMNEYYLHCADRGAKPQSIQAYREQTVPFDRWLETIAPEFGYKLTPDRMREFSRWLRDEYRTSRGEPLTQTGQSNTLRRVRSVFTWLYQQQYCAVNMAIWVPQLPKSPRGIRPLDTDSMVRLFVATEQSRGIKSVRNRALLALMFGTGARVAEVLAVRIEHLKFFDDDSGTVYLSVTKGDKPRTSVFGPVCGAFLQDYLATTPLERGRLWDFTSRSNVNATLRKLTDLAGIPHISSHDVRKFFISYWWRHYPQSGGFDKRFLEMQVGHAPATTTEKYYVFLNTENIQKYYVSPLEEKAVQLAQLMAGRQRWAEAIQMSQAQSSTT